MGKLTLRVDRFIGGRARAPVSWLKWVTLVPAPIVIKAVMFQKVCKKVLK